MTTRVAPRRITSDDLQRARALRRRGHTMQEAADRMGMPLGPLWEAVLRDDLRRRLDIHRRVRP